MELYFEDQLGRKLEQLREGAIARLQDERKQVESGSGPDPTQFLAHLISQNK